MSLRSLSRYIEEHVQRAGVAIETQGFTFVTSGRKRESLTVSAGFLVFDFRSFRQDVVLIGRYKIA